MTKVIEKFIDDLKKQCSDNGINLYLPDTKNVKIDNGNFARGYFDEVTLACAMGRNDFIFTLVHESCHLDQFLEKSELWVKASDSLLDDWLAGKNIDNIQKHIDSLKWLELDCEKRAVKKMKKYKIPFNEYTYIQKANAYVQFYNFMGFSRRWCKKQNTPYGNRNVWSEMPGVFVRRSWYNGIGEHEMKVFIRNNF